MISNTSVEINSSKEPGLFYNDATACIIALV